MKPIRWRRRIVRIVVAQSGQIGAFQQHLAAGRAIDASQEVQQRALARARRAHDRQEFALFDLQVNAPQGLDAQIAAAIGLSQGSRFQESIAFLPCIYTRK